MNRASLLKEIRNPDKLIKLLKHDTKLIKYILSDVEIKLKHCRLPDDVNREMKQASRKLGLAESEFIALGVICLLGEIR